MGEGRASPGRIAFFALSISPIRTPAYAEPQPDTSCYNAALPRICSPLAQARDTKASTVYHGNVGLRRPSLALSEKGGSSAEGVKTDYASARDRCVEEVRRCAGARTGYPRWEKKWRLGL